MDEKIWCYKRFPCDLMTVFKSMFGFFLFICLCIYGKPLFVVTMRFMYCCLVAKSCPTLLSSTDCQALLPMRFPRQEYRSEFPFPAPKDLPNPGTEPMSPALAGWFFTTEPPGKPRGSYIPTYVYNYLFWWFLKSELILKVLNFYSFCHILCFDVKFYIFCVSFNYYYRYR